MVSATALPNTVTPNESDSRLARESSRVLSAYLKGNVRFKIPETKESIELPAIVVQLLVSVLSELAEGNAVTIVPIHAELTTQQAADLLGVSRPFLVNLIDNGLIPFRKVGTHRRILFSDLIAYKQTIDSKRLESLAELTRQAQELNMGY
ncbi:MAG: hypothetical protein HJJLKODD_02999 [Phycisphaerae bacterium]|nr:hypothetical protein [Phycisphaerae bacterium]